jgi:hypothetical protein
MIFDCCHGNSHFWLRVFGRTKARCRWVLGQDKKRFVDATGADGAGCGENDGEETVNDRQSDQAL